MDFKGKWVESLGQKRMQKSEQKVKTRQWYRPSIGMLSYADVFSNLMQLYYNLRRTSLASAFLLDLNESVLNYRCDLTNQSGYIDQVVVSNTMLFPTTINRSQRLHLYTWPYIIVRRKDAAIVLFFYLLISYLLFIYLCFNTAPPLPLNTYIILLVKHSRL